MHLRPTRPRPQPLPGAGDGIDRAARGGGRPRSHALVGGAKQLGVRLLSGAPSFSMPQNYMQPGNPKTGPFWEYQSRPVDGFLRSDPPCRTSLAYTRACASSISRMPVIRLPTHRRPLVLPIAAGEPSMQDDALRSARSGWGHCYERVRSPASLVVRIGKLRTLAFVPTSAQKSCDTIILRTYVSEAAVKPWPMPNSTLTGSALSSTTAKSVCRCRLSGSKWLSWL